jgi:hypothetical protein
MMETLMQVRLILYVMILQKRYWSTLETVGSNSMIPLTLRKVSTPSGNGTNTACLPLPALASVRY